MPSQGRFAGEAVEVAGDPGMLWVGKRSRPGWAYTSGRDGQQGAAPRSRRRYQGGARHPKTCELRQSFRKTALGKEGPWGSQEARNVSRPSAIYRPSCLPGFLSGTRFRRPPCSQ